MQGHKKTTTKDKNTMTEHTPNIQFQKALFSNDLPFKPQGRLILYVETGTNEEINAYFRRKLETANNILGKSFTYLPAVLDNLEQIVEYNWPETDPVWLKATEPDGFKIQEIYRDIISYQINTLEKTPELSLNITRSPLLMRYEHYDEDGIIFTLFPLCYRDDAQFERLLKDISMVSYLGSGVSSSTIIEAPLRRSRLTETRPDPKERADRERIDLLTDEIRERIEQLRLMGVSDYMIRKLMPLPKPKLSALRITKDHRILLPDYNNIEITMPTLSKVVYFFFLRHPEGLKFKELIDHREEMLRLYYRVSNRNDIDKLDQSIDELIDSSKNSINEKCSRIRSAFVSQFSDELAKNYYITGYCASTKKITLDRNLVIDEANILR